ncbi:MAG TPA: MBL fold metallo-hydrolase [Terriglobia bacterium]|nr:MBL fold metallo-hydrolase [Terriglobia bacterium]
MKLKLRPFLRISVAVLCAGALAVVYARQQEPAKLDTVKVKDDLYVIHNDVVPGNITVLVTNEGLLLVDDKFEVDHANVMAEIKKFSSQPVKYVINTHYHGDHSGGNARLQQLGATVISSVQARQSMVDGNQPGLPAIAVDRRASVHLGNKTVELYYFGRAHTNGDIVAYFPAHRVLSTGDMFAYGDATPELVDYPGGGSAKEWTNALNEALKLDFDVAVPGHGVVTTKAEMAKFRDTSIALKNRVHAMLVQNKSRAEIAKMLTDEFHFAQFHIDRSLDGLMVELR